MTKMFVCGSKSLHKIYTSSAKTRFLCRISHLLKDGVWEKLISFSKAKYMKQTSLFADSKTELKAPR